MFTRKKHTKIYPCLIITTTVCSTFLQSRHKIRLNLHLQTMLKKLKKKKKNRNTLLYSEYPTQSKSHTVIRKVESQNDSITTQNDSITKHTTVADQQKLYEVVVVGSCPTRWSSHSIKLKLKKKSPKKYTNSRSTCKTKTKIKTNINTSRNSRNGRERKRVQI